jgi:hypothetical protein
MKATPLLLTSTTPALLSLAQDTLDLNRLCPWYQRYQGVSRDVDYSRYDYA